MPSPQLAVPTIMGPGGEHTYSSWIVRSGRPVPSGRTLAREGVVRLGIQCPLCRPPGLAPP